MPPLDGEAQTLDPQAVAEENARLRAELEAARRDKAEAEQRASTLDGQVVQASTRVQSAQVAQIEAQERAATDTIAAMDQQIQDLERKQAALNAEGKFDEAAALNRAIASATYRYEEAQRAKTYYASQKTQVASAPTDPVEQYIAANRHLLNDTDMAWIRQNRRFATDQAFQNRAIAAHTEALNNGLTPRSPEYYQLLERRGYSRPDPAPATATEAGQAAGGAASTNNGDQTNQDGAAPSGYADDNPLSDTGDGPEIVIEPSGTQPVQTTQPNAAGAFGRAPEQPQQRAAGTGSMRAAVAASPTRRMPNTTADGRRIVVRMTPEQRETAMALAPTLAPKEVLEGGEPRILQWYMDNNGGGAAQRIREGWG
jgi:hypothetical protein